jgi:hypothetical protein
MADPISISVQSQRIKAGLNVWGPFTPGAGYNAFQVTFDVTALVPYMRVRLLAAMDGGAIETAIEVGNGTFSGPWNDMFGQPHTSSRFGTSLGSGADGSPVQTTAATKLWLTADADVAYNCTGAVLGAS